MPTLMSHRPYNKPVEGLIHFYVDPNNRDKGFFEVYLVDEFERHGNLAFIHDSRDYAQDTSIPYKPLIYMDKSRFEPIRLVGIHLDHFGVVKEGQIIAGYLDIRLVSTEALRSLYFELLSETVKVAVMEKIDGV